VTSELRCENLWGAVVVGLATRHDVDLDDYVRLSFSVSHVTYRGQARRRGVKESCFFPAKSPRSSECGGVTTTTLRSHRRPLTGAWIAFVAHSLRASYSSKSLNIFAGYPRLLECDSDIEPAHSASQDCYFYVDHLAHGLDIDGRTAARLNQSFRDHPSPCLLPRARLQGPCALCNGHHL
jgi:hypothetical protein